MEPSWFLYYIVIKCMDEIILTDISVLWWRCYTLGSCCWSEGWASPGCPAQRSLSLPAGSPALNWGVQTCFYMMTTIGRNYYLTKSLYPSFYNGDNFFVETDANRCFRWKFAKIFLARSKVGEIIKSGKPRRGKNLSQISGVVYINISEQNVIRKATCPGPVWLGGVGPPPPDIHPA